MGLPASQHQVLAAIEDELNLTDPALAADFADFGGGLSCPPGPWPLPPSRSRLPASSPGGWWRRLVSRCREGRRPGPPAS